MLRQRENTDSFKAGMLSVAVHAVLLGALLISFNWKTTHPVSIAEVELWDSIPSPSLPAPVPVPEPVVKAPEPPPEPEPVVEDKPEAEPEVDIALEKKQKELEQKKLAEKLKKDQELAQKKKLAEVQAALLKDESILRENKKTRQQNDALKKLQQEALADDKAVGDQHASAARTAASAGVVDEYKSKIQAKIRANVNKTLCGDGNPQLVFDIALLPTGQLSSSPKLVKSSGSAACDDAVERAIMASEPLPLPSDASLFSQFRNLKLKFSPKDS